MGKLQPANDRDTNFSSDTASTVVQAISASNLDRGHIHKEPSLEQSASTPSALTARKVRPLLPLLPKPAIVTPVRQIARPRLSRTQTPRLPGPCGIPICEKLSCRLTSHRAYARRLKQYAARSTGSDDTIDDDDFQAEASSSHLSPNALITTTVPKLPLPDGQQNNPIFRKLFNDFFLLLTTRMMLLVVPPFQNYAAWLKQRQKFLFENGINSALDCLNYVGAAHCYFAPRAGRSMGKEDEVGLAVQNGLLKALRDSLEKYDPHTHAERVLSIILTLVIAEINSRPDTRTLLAHKDAMIKVVNSYGGLHHLGYSTPFAMALDRMISVQLGSKPLYTTWASVTIPISRAALYPQKYGEAFECYLDPKLIHPDIRMYSREICRAIEILEGENWTFREVYNPPSNELYYFHYLKDRATGLFAHLNARTFHDNTEERCLLLAAKVVEYIVVMDNFVPAIAMTNADRLHQLLKQQRDRKFGGKWKQATMWMHFVLGCMPDYWPNKRRAIELLHDALRRSYDNRPWPEGWQEEQLTNCRRFVWSNSRFDTIFEVTCQMVLRKAVA